MKVLVTGADGYIGAVLTPLLHARGHEVVGLDCGFYRSGWLFDDENWRAPVITKDIRQVDAADVAGFDAVIHLAELSNDPLGEHDPALTYAINHQGSADLAHTCKCAGVTRFIYASSCSVYGAAGDGAIKTEESPPDPQTAYARCKLLVERDLRALADRHFTPVILRNATAYGASPRMRFDIVLNNLAGHAWTSGEVKMMSDGTPWRPLVHVGDIAEAIVQALEAPRERVHNEIFNVGEDVQNYRIKEIAAIVAEAFPGTITTLGKLGADNRSYRVSFAKIHRHLAHFHCRRNAQGGARELAHLFERIAMSSKVFNHRAFTRVEQLKYLLATGRIDHDFFFVRELEPVAVS
ncbi:MAG TPA: SDR family oxidoreductase [Stellaceae bacterium]|nr:SDR family oxidoreductase [Stellaceae bacterium]